MFSGGLSSGAAEFSSNNKSEEAREPNIEYELTNSTLELFTANLPSGGAGSSHPRASHKWRYLIAHQP